MAMQAKEVTAKGATATPSRKLLSDDAPELRTPEAIHRKQEQIVHAIDTSTVTPKQAEQLNMAIKGLYRPIDLRFRYMQMLVKYGNKTPVVKDEMLRRFLGEPPKGSFEE